MQVLTCEISKSPITNYKHNLRKERYLQYKKLRSSNGFNFKQTSNLTSPPTTDAFEGPDTTSI